MEGKKKTKIYEQAKKLIVKSQDDCDLLENDPEKDNFMSNYRKNIINFANCGRKRQNNIQVSQNSLAGTELTLSQLELQP